MYGKPSVLIVTKETDHGERLAATALRLGLRPVCCRTLGAAGLLANLHHRMVFCDEALPDGDFRGVIEEISHADAYTPVIVVSEQGDWNSYFKAMKAGAFDCVGFSGGPGEIERIARSALREVECQARAAA